MDVNVTHKHASTVWLLVVVAIIGLNLRPFMTGIGPLAESLRDATGLSQQGLSMLTLIPMALMGVVAFAGPALQGKLGARLLVILALLVIAIGAILRWVTTSGGVLLLTAAIMGFGVAIIQAVFPGIIKRQFMQRSSVVMGLYSAMMMGGGALGAQLSPWVAQATGSWQIGLAWLVMPALLALFLAVKLLPMDPPRSEGKRVSITPLLRRRRTWLLMLCFGLVNGGYSSAVAWLAPAYQSLGWSAAYSGSLLAVMAIAQAVAALVLPAIACRKPDFRPWLWFTLALQLVGFAGLAFWPAAAPLLWAIVVGAGLGGCFSLTMVVALEHLKEPAQAGALAALMQGGGFLLAAMAPWIVATLYDATESYMAGWVWHVGCVAVVSVLVWQFAPKGYAQAMGVSVSAE
ncbi:cyanate transporter [Paenalcaligenes sp. Me131]|uniref:cyanate transporter n=1 Tax=Paenalcaligenes sp. Me131 TaxID=3392636 RepID=UPI003D28F0E7